MSLQVSLGLWQDRPARENLATARFVDELGFGAIWIGEMATYDAFALAVAVGQERGGARLVLGPLAVTVRDPMTIAVGAASVASLTGRPVEVALGSSSPMVVEQWHGRSRARSVRALAESATAVRALLSGDKPELPGEVVGSRGYRLRLPPVPGALTLAAFGDGALDVAGRLADRLVLNLLDPVTAGRLAARVREVAHLAGRPQPRVAVWAPAAVDPGPAAREQLRRAVVGYLGAPGYAEMLIAAGFPDVVALARRRPHPAELLAAVPDELVEAVGVVGTQARARARVQAYTDAGVDDVVLVPSSTDEDPAAAKTLRAAAAWSCTGAGV